MSLPMFAMLQGWEVVGLLVLALLLFGAKKLPELARGLGHGIKEFKKATRDVQDEIQNSMDSDPPPPRSRDSKKLNEPATPTAAAGTPQTESSESKD